MQSFKFQFVLLFWLTAWIILRCGERLKILNLKVLWYSSKLVSREIKFCYTATSNDHSILNNTWCTNFGIRSFLVFIYPFEITPGVSVFLSTYMCLTQHDLVMSPVQCLLILIAMVSPFTDILMYMPYEIVPVISSMISKFKKFLLPVSNTFFLLLKNYS